MAARNLFNELLLKQIHKCYKDEVLINPLYVPIYLIETTLSVFLKTTVTSGIMITEYKFKGGEFAEVRKVNLTSKRRVRRTRYSASDFVSNKIAPALIYSQCYTPSYLFYSKLPEDYNEELTNIWGYNRP